MISVEEGDSTIIPVHNAYNQGLYKDALDHFAKAIEIASDVQEELYPHLLICRRVLAISKDYRDGLYDESIIRWKSSFLRRFRKSPDMMLRCKYCGHYTEYISPNNGWGWTGNQCHRCRRDYPMPDFLCDSIDGQAYIYYRGAVSDPTFYREFEDVFDVEEPSNWRTR